jgi:hypothetical protein
VRFLPGFRGDRGGVRDDALVVGTAVRATIRLLAAAVRTGSLRTEEML